jgi:pSer/pThr/pTyr-binding forkhead associated (FHA) protein
MKLIFPNGEHPQALLNEGINRIGSAPDSQVRLDLDGIAPVHCELQVQATGVTLRIPDPSHPITLNGKPVQGVMALRNNDMLGIAGVQARYVVVEVARGRSASAGAEDDDSGATRLRMAVPKFVLRGVSGPVFGKAFPVPGPVVIGRAPECDISVASDEVSRRHVQVRPISDGLSVEDLGSSNGTYVNGQRLQQGFLKPGDELRLDTVRFLLVAPGMEIPASQKATVRAPGARRGGPNKAGIFLAALAASAIGAAVVVYFLR